LGNNEVQSKNFGDGFMVEKIKLVEKKLLFLEEHFVIYSLLSLVCLQILQVIFRYFLSNPLGWIDESSRYLFIYMIMVGSAVGVQWFSHFSVDFIVNKFPARLKKLMTILITIISFAFISYLIYYSMTYIQSAKGQVTPALMLPIEVPYYALPIGSLLMIFHLVFNVISNLSGSRIKE
jgi:TRAP-type C4-dicarboxylate transport system permease small subunit